MVSIIIVTYNGRDFIKDCLESVFKQTYTDIEIIVLDNNSSDGTGEFLKKLAVDSSQLAVMFNEKNRGFSGGYNQGIRESHGKYILCLNQDVILDKDFVRAGVEIFENDDKIGAVQGKIYRYEPENSSPAIDTTGLMIFKNRRVIRRGEGEKDQGQYDKMEEIFGVDGAAAFYRRKALENIKLPTTNCQLSTCNGEYLDQDFFLYKEDIDLSWRLRLYDWKIIYCPKAVARHHRKTKIHTFPSLRGTSKASDEAIPCYTIGLLRSLRSLAMTLGSSKLFNIVKSRIEIPSYAKFYSFKNQRLMQIKNEIGWLFLKHLPWILVREISEWLYVLFFEKEGRRSIWQLFRQAPNAWRKRKIIMANKKTKFKEMERWFK